MVAEDALRSSYDEGEKGDPTMFACSLVFELLFISFLAVEARPDVREFDQSSLRRAPCVPSHGPSESAETLSRPTACLSHF